MTSDEMCTLVLAPTGRDATLISSLLGRLGKPCCVVSSVSELSEKIASGAGAAIVTEEALRGNAIRDLEAVLKEQPAWSDFPVILLVAGGRVTAESERLRRLRMPLGNVLLLERPLRPETLLSTLEVALRGRQRQYQVRDQMEQMVRAQDALRRAEKLAVTGRLAASIAHEINNPLESVTNLLYLLRSETSSENARIYLGQAEQELARVTEITKHTLRYYREPNKPVPVDVSAVLDSMLALYHSRLTAARIDVRKEARSATVSVYANPGELRQVIANLISNSLDAMRTGGKLRLRIGCWHSSKMPDRRYLGLTIADTGSGIDPQLLPTVFEPFVTTKGETGTGLGLWVTQELVKKNGWAVRVRSSTNPDRRGTVFSILIPAEQAEASSTSVAA
ncbi:MAG: hybrid sensor histidine kinase/response regulator [Acidobacteriaceae bacterium]|nr:hybrid sensor histidine kinase/response regulator [Acidobacteriaceae bacterium]